MSNFGKMENKFSIWFYMALICLAFCVREVIKNDKKDE
jgi:hypothetical protein